MNYVGIRDNFRGSIFSFKFVKASALLQVEIVFNLYWAENTLAKIKNHTNLYTQTILPKVNPDNLDELP